MKIKRKRANLMRITRTRDYAACYKQLENLRPRNAKWWNNSRGILTEQTVMNNLLHATVDGLECWLNELKYRGKISCSKEDCGQVFCSEVEMLYHWLDCYLIGFYTSMSHEKSTTRKKKAPTSGKKKEVQNVADSSQISLNCASQSGMKNSSQENASVSQKVSISHGSNVQNVSEGYRDQNTVTVLSLDFSTFATGSSKPSVSRKSVKKKENRLLNVTKKAVDCGSKKPQFILPKATPATFLQSATNSASCSYGSKEPKIDLGVQQCLSQSGSTNPKRKYCDVFSCPDIQPKRECPDMLHNKALAMDDKGQPDAIVPDRENSGTSFNSSILSVKQEDCEEIVIKIERSDFPEDEMDSENGRQLQEFDYGNDSVQHDSVLGFGMPTFHEKHETCEERPTCSGSSVADVTITPMELVANVNTSSQLNSIIEIEMDEPHIKTEVADCETIE